MINKKYREIYSMLSEHIKEIEYMNLNNPEYYTARKMADPLVNLAVILHGPLREIKETLGVKSAVFDALAKYEKNLLKVFKLVEEARGMIDDKGVLKKGKMELYLATLKKALKSFHKASESKVELEHLIQEEHGKGHELLG